MKKLLALMTATLLCFALCATCLAEDAAPTLACVNAQGAPYGAVAVGGLGEDNALRIYFATENADNMRVGWDDAALIAAGVQIAIEFDGGFHLRLHSDEPAECAVRFYLSATEDWSDAANPPAEQTLRVVFTDKPTLLATDARGAAYDASATGKVGQPLPVYFYTPNAEGMRVGWDDQAFINAGISLAISFDNGFGLVLNADAPTQCAVRFYLSAMEDWSDADNPPAETTLNITFE